MNCLRKRFRAIANEMGDQLQRTAFSVNVKERLDFSCALLDANAQLVANAPHIPVHLGSLGVCARLVLAKIPINPGDVVITNHPEVWRLAPAGCYADSGCILGRFRTHWLCHQPGAPR